MYGHTRPWQAGTMPIPTGCVLATSECGVLDARVLCGSEPVMSEEQLERSCRLRQGWGTRVGQGLALNGHLATVGASPHVDAGELAKHRLPVIVLA